MSEHPSTIGPYVIQDVLGRGGMGIVYRAVHGQGGPAVALKTVPTASPRHWKRLRREIAALGQVDHPGVVRVYEQGVQDGVPWYTMELVSGPSLRDRLPRTWSEPTASLHSTLDDPGSAEPVHFETYAALTPERLDEILGMGLELCRTLGHLHARGIVHRDLKPENILVHPRGHPVLVDFGLTHQLEAGESRERLEIEPHLVGTVFYMSPEQIEGAALDARSDLYSLGCVLYELLTGRPPFIGDWSAVIEGHLREAVAPPSAVVSGIPYRVDGLVVRLLQKERRRRFGYAEDVAGRLAEIQGVGTVPPVEAPRLYRPGFFGRDDDLDRLKGVADGLAAGRSGTVLLLGEAGVGKTRLVVESATRFPPEFSVFVGQCQPRAAGGRESRRPLEPFLGILQEVADRCHALGPEETARLLGSRGGVLSRYQPALEGLTEAVSLPGDLSPAGARQFVYEALHATLNALGDADPYVLVLDDLHWADELTLGFLGFRLKSQEDVLPPSMVLATCRPEEAGEQLSELMASGGCRVIRLAPLGSEAVAAMTGDMLSLEEPPPRLVETLVERCGGNPFFVAEQLRAAAAEDLLSRDPARGWRMVETPRSTGEMTIPASVREIIRRRIDRLDERPRRVLQAAAVLRIPFEEEALDRVVPEVEAPAAELRTLVLAQLLTDSDRKGFRFAHDELREAAYERTPPDERVRLHAAVATWFDQTGSDDPATIGHHWEAAGEPVRARASYLAGARRAADAFALDDAERLYRSCLRQEEGPSRERIEALNELGSRVLTHTGRSREALSCHQAARVDAEELGEPALLAQCLNQLAGVKRRLGTVEEVEELYAEALRISREIGDRSGVLSGLSNLAITAFVAGRYDQARENWTLVLQSLRESGDRGRQATVLCNLAGLEVNEDQSERALALFSEAIELAREDQDRMMEGILIGNLAVTLLSLDRFDEARPHFEEALARHRELGNRGSEGQLLRHYARLLEHEDRPEEADQVHREAIDLLMRIEDFGNCATALIMWGEFHESQGRRREASECYREARSLAERSGHQSTRERAERSLKALGGPE